jgi:chemotaxis protein CheD
MNAVTQQTIHVIQGEHHVDDRRDTLMTTVLGSCVAACVYDPVRGIGGMNHFLLPDGEVRGDIRHASAAMEQLVNSLLKRGAQRVRLEAKLFGGARMIAGLPDIGKRNGEAAVAFLRSEGISLRAHSLGGTAARRVRFWPALGKAQQMLLQDPRDPRTEQAASPPPTGSIELF